MNKFVKGAKNLAFALSFVTVVACGGVKDADLKALEEKINNKLDGKANNGQGYALKNDIKDCVRKSEIEVLVKSEDLDNRIDALKKETVSLDVLDKAFVNSPESFVKLFGGGVKLSDGVFSKGKVTFSEWEAKGKCKVEVKVGEKKIFEVSTAAVLSEETFDILKECIGGGAAVDWRGKLIFESEAKKGVKFNGVVFDIEADDAVLNLARLLDLCYLAGKKFDDLKFGCWDLGSSDKVGGKEFKDGNKEENKILVDVLNKFKSGCCVVDDSCTKITFKKGMGWTSDGSSPIVEDVVVAFKS